MREVEHISLGVGVASVGAGGLLTWLVWKLATLQAEVSPEEEAAAAPGLGVGALAFPRPAAPSEAPVVPDIVEVPTQPTFYLRLDALEPFLAMEQAALAAGIRLPISTAWRSRKHQERLWAAYQAYRDLVARVGVEQAKSAWAPMAAKPGTSNHEKGIAIDFLGITPGNPNFNATRSEWLRTYAVEFEWYNSVPSEPWHWAWRVKREGLRALKS